MPTLPKFLVNCAHRLAAQLSVMGEALGRVPGPVQGVIYDRLAMKIVPIDISRPLKTSIAAVNSDASSIVHKK